ncbi:probable salivary secreted peptide isoform X1 [Temnothorax curvispinosus]|uniref:Probable salivary secreted peptide isoform X1 n=1 Tax=Temnothorax curvispinosus TaxID=300111 RepID=A0A6J1PX77_9HYME|nr:probable salivary secreted peptide isoform X1 [Temnothorax curvispinosus]
MSAYNYIPGLAFLVTILLTINTVSANGSIDSYAPAYQASNNLIAGSRVPGDRLVYLERIVKNSSWGKVQVIERTFDVSRWGRITLIEALDQTPYGAYVSILEGGLGHNYVTMKFQSQKDHSIKFLFQLFARPNYP